VVCDFFTEAGGGEDIQDAAIAAITDENEALPLRRGIDKVTAFAARTTDPRSSAI
jgi:hypothetical protein